MSAFGGKADIGQTSLNLLLTQSGHSSRQSGRLPDPHQTKGVEYLIRRAIIDASAFA